MKRLTAVVVALAMVAGACGGGDGGSDIGPEATDSGDNLPDRATTTEGTDAPVETTLPDVDDGPDLVCGGVVPVEIGFGEVAEGTSGGEIDQCFWIDVPEGLDAMTVELTGLTASTGVGVAYGFLHYLQFPGVGPYWYASSGDAAAAVVTVPRPEAGPHVLLVSPAAFEAVSDYAVTVTAEPATTTAGSGRTLADATACAAPAIPVGFGQPVEGEMTPEASDGRDWLPRQYYCVEVPDGVSSITIELTEVDGLIEMFARGPSSAFGTDRNRTGPTRTIVLDGFGPGVYFIDVAAAVAGGASTYTLTVRET